MSLMPELDFGWATAWWYTAAFGIANLLLLALSPQGVSKRLFRLPAFESLWEKAASLVSVFVFARALMIYTVFVPLRLRTWLFWLGSAVFVCGLIGHSVAMVGFSRTPPDQPVVRGAYRLTRHPMQLIAIVMWLGVAMATFSWVIGLVCFLQLFLSRPFLLAQERMCLAEYGEDYRQYMSTTPRYIRPFS